MLRERQEKIKRVVRGSGLGRKEIKAREWSVRWAEKERDNAVDGREDSGNDDCDDDNN